MPGETATCRSDSIRVTITLDLPDELCADVMSAALEGGIGYWCAAGTIVRSPGADWEYIGFEAYDTETNDYLGEVGYDTIRRGIQRILGGEVRIRGDLVRQVLTVTDHDRMDIDAEAADCIVQAGLFGAVEFG